MTKKLAGSREFAYDRRMDYFSTLRPLLFVLPPETAHRLAIRALGTGWLPHAKTQNDAALRSRCFGLDFPNPVGLAAGFDKNAVAVKGLFAQGFGFVEVGTVTPVPQPGNPAPRLFRLEEDAAIINRLGFNNEGLHAFCGRLKMLAGERLPGTVGANIGRNKDSLEAAHDYVRGLEAVYPFADYITVNISSPNTVGLRDLQQKQALSELMATLEQARASLAAKHGVTRPLLYKIAPDLSPQDKEDIAELALARQVDGLIVTNTTIARPTTLKSRHAQEKGGLSGAPLSPMSRAVLGDLYRLTQGKIPLISVGGIASAEEAYARLKAGASLVQLYTGLIYQGFGLVARINAGLASLMAADGAARLSDIVGQGAR